MMAELEDILNGLFDDGKFEGLGAAAQGQETVVNEAAVKIRRMFRDSTKPISGVKIVGREELALGSKSYHWPGSM